MRLATWCTDTGIDVDTHGPEAPIHDNEYERCSDSDEKGALLCREGLYSRHIVEWRRTKEVGALDGGVPKLRRSKRSAKQAEIDRLRDRNEKLEDQLQKHKRALESHGKASELLAKLEAESAKETTHQPKRSER